MLAFHLFTFFLPFFAVCAHPILPRQDEQLESISASFSVRVPLASGSATPTLSGSLESSATPVPSASESVKSIASVSESSAPASASSVSESAPQVSETVLSTSSATPTPSSTVELEPDVPTFTPDPITVTNTLPASSVTRFIIASSEPSGSAVASGGLGTQKSFWDNKPAVIGTFVVVGLIALSLIALAFFAIRKRKLQESLDNDFFEKFNDTHSERSESRVGSSPHPSMADMHSQKPMAVNDYGTSAVAPHLAFNTQNYSDGYGSTGSEHPRSHGRNGSGDSFYGAAAAAQRMPTYRY